MTTSGLSLGYYYGDGSSSSSSSSSSTRAASSSNIKSFARNAAAGYSTQIESIESWLKKGNVDKAMSIFDSTVEELASDSSYYKYNLNESQIQSALSTAYESVTGTSFTTAIEKNTSGSFATGLAEGIPIAGWFFADGTSEEEALSKLAGEETGFRDKAKEVIGSFVSGAISGAGIGATIGTFAAGPGTGTAIGAGIGAVIGAVSGTAVSIIRNIIQN